MKLPKEPTLADYQLSEGKISCVTRRDNLFSLSLFLIFQFTFYVLAVAVFSKGEPDLFTLNKLGLAFAVLFAGAIPSIIMADMFKKLIFTRLFKDYKNYQIYLLKKDEWKDHCIKVQESFWTSLSGLEFEHEIATLYRKLGYKTEVTTSSNDGGIDVWVEKDGQRIAIQCKAHKKAIGPGSARDFFGAMRHFGVSKGILISINGFTVGVYKFVNDKPIELITLDDIIRIQQQEGYSGKRKEC